MELCRPGGNEMEGSKPLSLANQVRRQHSKRGVTRIAELPENRQRISEGQVPNRQEAVFIQAPGVL